jgi:hypothetical protein
MAKILDLIISYDVANLTELSVLDTTLCTSPDTISQVNGVRLLFQTVNSVANTAEATVCEAWFEYEVLSHHEEPFVAYGEHSWKIVRVKSVCRL